MGHRASSAQSDESRTCDCGLGIGLSRPHQGKFRTPHHQYPDFLASSQAQGPVNLFHDLQRKRINKLSCLHIFMNLLDPAGPRYYRAYMRIPDQFSLTGFLFLVIKPVSHELPFLIAHFCQVSQRHAPHHYNCLVNTFGVLNQFVFIIQLNP